MTGARILLETLKHLGIKEIFGYPGGAVLSIFDALREDNDIKFILPRHEQCASHAADASGRLTGVPGVCLATSGPGATNLVTGIMTAYMDSSPMIAITGQVSRVNKGKDVFQEVDIVGVTMPITKHNYSVESLEELPMILKEAFHIATTGRPGPVLIDIPADIQNETMDEDRFKVLLEQKMDLFPSLHIPKLDMTKVQKALDLLKNAKRPLIISGAGVIRSGASEGLYNFATKNNIPVTSSLLGLGGFPGDNKLFLGMGGVHGSIATNIIIQEADVVLAVGTRLDNRLTCDTNDFLEQAKVIHIDIDPAENKKIIVADVFIQGDAKEALEKMAEMSEGKKEQLWLDRVDELRGKYSPTKFSEKYSLEPRRIFELLSERTDENAIITTDVGQHQMWTAQYYKFRKPKTLITSGGAGAMGFGIPAAIAAKIKRPDTTVISVVGDGGFQMCLGEIIMLKQYKLPIKIIIINNSTLGMVKQLQDTFKGGKHFGVYLDESPDFMDIAKAYRIKGVRVTNEEELIKSYDENIDTDEPVIIECILERKKNVYQTLVHPNL
jgi:acetolactate synthase-1/2/3 large subunit